MPNGDDKNWVCVCAAIDGFRGRYGRWPKRVRIMPVSYVDLVSHVLTPLGYAVVSSYVELVPEEDAEMIADDDSGNEYCYGKEGFPKQEAELPASEWFGAAILRQGLGCGLEYVTVRDADGNLIWTGKGVQEAAAQKKKRIHKRQTQGHEEDIDPKSSIRRTRLVEAMRSLTPEMRSRLAELKAQGERIRSRPDLIWRLLLESFSTMGNSRGYEGLFGNRELVELSAFESVVSVPQAKRKAYLEDILRRAKIRMPSKKAEWLVTNVEMIVGMGGLEAARRYALGLIGREVKLNFMTSFHGIRDKYGRNVWMIQYDRDFRGAIAVDERIESVTEELCFTFRNYSEHEGFYCQVAAESNLEPWEVDRLLYWFRDHFVNAIRGSP